MREFLCIAMMVLTLLLTACSSELPHKNTPAGVDNPMNPDAFNVSTGEQPPTNGEENKDVNNKEERMEGIIRELVEKNYTCITTLFYFGNLPYDTVEIDGEVPIAKVESSKYGNIQDLKDFLGSVYVQPEVDRLLNKYFDDRPLYFEKDGVLYLYVEQTTSAGMPYSWQSFEIIITEQTETTCNFNTEVTYAGDIEDKAVYEFTAVKTDEGWRLKSLVKSPAA